jgi:hypothetical protein
MFAESSPSFNIENMVDRQSSYAKILCEYSHVCSLQYKVEYPLCQTCIRRLETRGNSPNECTCGESKYITEHCAKCSEIKEEIQFLRNEIRRSCTNYGIEVAESLETSPLFEQSIDRLVLRIQLLEQVLLYQHIERERKNEHRPEPHVVSDAKEDGEYVSEEETNDVAYDDYQNTYDMLYIPQEEDEDDDIISELSFDMGVGEIKESQKDLEDPTPDIHMSGMRDVLNGPRGYYSPLSYYGSDALSTPEQRSTPIIHNYFPDNNDIDNDEIVNTFTQLNLRENDDAEVGSKRKRPESIYVAPSSLLR